MGQTVNLLAHAYVGSNPTSPNYADIAQMVEQFTCNEKVVGSIPTVSN